MLSGLTASVSDRYREIELTIKQRIKCMIKVCINHINYYYSSYLEFFYTLLVQFCQQSQITLIISNMDTTFHEDIINRHKNISHIPSSKDVKTWTEKTITIMFPEYPSEQLDSIDNVEIALKEQKVWLMKIMNQIKSRLSESPNDIAEHFFKQLPAIYQLLKLDVESFVKCDPAAFSQIQIIRSYPGFKALAFYRIAHQLYRQKVPLIPRMITEIAHSKTGIDINPGAQIGKSCFIDHATGTVIGQTAIIGENCRIFQGVTLGALSVSKKSQQLKRHPTIQDYVTLYAGATVLGGNTVIGHHSIIGGNVWLTQSVPPYSKVFHKPQIEISTKKSPQISHSIQQLIGNTPLVQIKNIFKHPHVKIFAKLEGQNPGGSVKDRAAFNMVQQALQRGQIKPGIKLIQPTSGNTGIALAMIASMFELQIQLVMPENSTAERVQTMLAYGAKVILTPAAKGIQGSRDYALKKLQQGGYLMLNQFDNPDNYLAHYKTTGPQVYRDTKGNITHFVSSMGTTGTITGTSMYLKQQNAEIQIIGVQPEAGAKIPGIRKWQPQYLPKIYSKERVDDIQHVSQKESIQMMKRMAKEQAIFAGMSSGGAMTVAVRLANKLERGTIVTIVCDQGDRYLSSNIFKDEKNKLEVVSF